MASATRDRSARSRIREHLAQRGPIDDPSGRATSLLKDAIDYKGSAVAFIQLVTAMDKSDEISREIRGKRTYRISAAANASLTGTTPSPTTAMQTVRSADTRFDIDYDELARAVLREMWRVVGATESAPVVGEHSDVSLAAVRVERDQLLAERDEYARRLQIARGQLSALIGSALPEGGTTTGVDAEGTRIEQAS